MMTAFKLIKQERLTMINSDISPEFDGKFNQKQQRTIGQFIKNLQGCTKRRHFIAISLTRAINEDDSV